MGLEVVYYSLDVGSLDRQAPCVILRGLGEAVINEDGVKRCFDSSYSYSVGLIYSKNLKIRIGEK